MPPTGDSPQASRPQSADLQRESDAPPLVAAEVRGEQVRTLYQHSAPVLLANVVNALIVCIALWSHVQQRLLVGWALSVMLMAVARVALRRSFWARERGPEEQARWGLYSTLGSLASGSLWGFAGTVLMPASLSHQLVIMFVIGGMAAGAAGSLSCFMPAYYTFVLSSLVPAIVRFLLFGGSEHLAMAAMLVMFLGALTSIALNVNRALTQAFRLRFENAGLYKQVSRAQTSLAHANEDLQRANDQLEARVRERTEALQASEQHLSEIVSESPDAIVVFDETGRIVDANPAAERISGRPGAALLGQELSAFGELAREDASRVKTLFEGVLAGWECPAEEFRIATAPEQEAIIEVKLRLVQRPNAPRRLHSVMRDVSERRRLQRLKESYELRLREAERLESVGMLAGGVAHDFNNVLTMILSNVALLDAFSGDGSAKALLGEIRHGSLQAANLTKQLLAFSRQQVLDVKPTDLGSVISHARPLFERALGEPNELAIALPLDPLVVLVDSTQVEQAILNLLMNARHAMPEGGRVELEVQRVELSSDVSWPDAEPGPYVRLTVTDTGTGMDEATRGRVFEPFFTTKERGHGTGLGLSSVHGVVKQAGGHIRVSSVPGKGSRFEIILPCHAAPVPIMPSATPAVWTPGTGTVLVVEDQPYVRRSLTHILEEAGYRVLAAESGEQALALARKRDGRIDLLVTDVIMPGVSGVELSRRLLGLYPELAVLLVSGYAGGEISAVAELGDNVQFLQKPFDAVSLTTAARAALVRAEAHSQPLTASSS
ncbi:MAG: ATP-binding protein [Polyangiales bacterium]